MGKVFQKELISDILSVSHMHVIAKKNRQLRLYMRDINQPARIREENVSQLRPRLNAMRTSTFNQTIIQQQEQRIRILRGNIDVLSWQKDKALKQRDELRDQIKQKKIKLQKMVNFQKKQTKEIEDFLAAAKSKRQKQLKRQKQFLEGLIKKAGLFKQQRFIQAYKIIQDANLEAKNTIQDAKRSSEFIVASAKKRESIILAQANGLYESAKKDAQRMKQEAKKQEAFLILQAKQKAKRIFEEASLNAFINNSAYQKHE